MLLLRIIKVDLDIKEGGPLSVLTIQLLPRFCIGSSQKKKEQCTFISHPLLKRNFKETQIIFCTEKIIFFDDPNPYFQGKSCWIPIWFGWITMPKQSYCSFHLN